MGAPKQKWTPEEEAALKAGIQKYGTGKWSTIIKDPEFSTVLRSRSNVDLKDKWRNLNCMANGLGSRHRVRVKSSHPSSKQDEDTKACSVMVSKDPEVLHVTPLAASNEISPDAISKKKISRLDAVILEAIKKLKEPQGSGQPAIKKYIVDYYSATPDFEKTLAAKLKIMTQNGLLIKVKNQYRIAPKSINFNGGEEPKLILENGGKKDDFQEERNGGIVLLTRAKIDEELEQMRRMGKEEIAAVAARAVAEAEVAIAEAEAAEREAEEAEAKHEAAQCVVDAMMKAFNGQAIHV